MIQFSRLVFPDMIALGETRKNIDHSQLHYYYYYYRHLSLVSLAL